MKDISNNTDNEYGGVGHSAFTYFLRHALRNFGIHIHNDFLICMSNFTFNLNYSFDKPPNYWLIEYIPEDILSFLSTTTGITLMNNKLPSTGNYPRNISNDNILVFAKWKDLKYPVWGFAEKMESEEEIYGMIMSHDGLIEKSSTTQIFRVIYPELSSFQISYDDIMKSMSKYALKYMGYSGPVSVDDYFFGIEFFQIWMEDLDSDNPTIKAEDSARFASTISEYASSSGKYFLGIKNEHYQKIGELLVNLSELISPFGKTADIEFILELEKQTDLLMEAITRVKEVYLLIRPELEKI